MEVDNLAQLHDHVVSKDYALDTNLPTDNAFARNKLGKMAADIGLFQDPTRTQLVNYKDAKCDSSQVELLINSAKLKKQRGLSLSMETNEFVPAAHNNSRRPLSGTVERVI